MSRLFRNKKNKAIAIALCLAMLVTSGCGGGTEKPKATSAAISDNIEPVPAETTGSSRETTTQAIVKTESWAGAAYDDPEAQEKLAQLKARVKTDLANKGIKIVASKDTTNSFYDTEGTIMNSVVPNKPTATTSDSAETGEVSETDTTETEEITAENFDLDKWVEQAVLNTFNGRSVFENNAFPKGSRVKESEWQAAYTKLLLTELSRRTFNGNAGYDYSKLVNNYDETNSETPLPTTGAALAYSYKLFAMYGGLLDESLIPTNMEKSELITMYRNSIMSIPGAWINPTSLINSMYYGMSEQQIKSSLSLANKVDYELPLYQAYASANYVETLPETVKFTIAELTLDSKGKEKAEKKSVAVKYDVSDYAKYTPFVVKNDDFCFPVVETSAGDPTYNQSEEDAAIIQASIDGSEDSEKIKEWILSTDMVNYIRPKEAAAENIVEDDKNKSKPKDNINEDTVIISKTVDYRRPWANISLSNTPAYRLQELNVTYKTPEREYSFKGNAYLPFMKNGIVSNVALRPSVNNMQKLNNWAITPEMKASYLGEIMAKTVEEWGITNNKPGVAGVYLANTYAYVPLTAAIRAAYGLENYSKNYVYVITSNTSNEATTMNRIVNTLWAEATKTGDVKQPTLKKYMQENADSFVNWYLDFFYTAETERLIELAVNYQKENGSLESDETIEGATVNTEVKETDGDTSDTTMDSAALLAALSAEDESAVAEALDLAGWGFTDAAEVQQIVSAYMDIKRKQSYASVELSPEAVKYAVEQLDSSDISASKASETFEAFVRELHSKLLLKEGYIWLSDDAIYDSINDVVLFENLADCYRDNGKTIWKEFCQLFGIDKDNPTSTDIAAVTTTSAANNVCDYAIQFTNGAMTGTIVRGANIVNGVDWGLQFPIISGVTTEAELDAMIMDYVVLVGAVTGESYLRSLDIALNGFVSSTVTNEYTFSMDYFKDFAILTITKG